VSARPLVFRYAVTKITSISSGFKEEGGYVTCRLAGNRKRKFIFWTAFPAEWSVNTVLEVVVHHVT